MKQILHVSLTCISVQVRTWKWIKFR